MYLNLDPLKWRIVLEFYLYNSFLMFIAPYWTRELFVL